jgi:hypothetical protein
MDYKYGVAAIRISAISFLIDTAIALTSNVIYVLSTLTTFTASSTCAAFRNRQ